MPVGCWRSPTACCSRPPGSVGYPVDVGWSWVVVAAAGGIFGFQGAAFKLFGMIYMQMLERFRSDPKITLWVFGVSGVMCLFFGPVVSMFVHRTSHRFVVATGSLCMATGILATGFAPSVYVTFFTWGVLYAFGVTCLLICGLTCSGPYFKKYRGLAVGIAASGNGVLAFILPNLLNELFEHFAFTGAMLLYSGVALQVLVLAMLVRPSSYYLPCAVPRCQRSSLFVYCGFDVTTCLPACFGGRKQPPPRPASPSGAEADRTADRGPSGVGDVTDGSIAVTALPVVASSTASGGGEAFDAIQTSLSHESAMVLAEVMEAPPAYSAVTSHAAAGEPLPAAGDAVASSVAADNQKLAEKPTDQRSHDHHHHQSTSYVELLKNPRMWLIGFTMLLVANAVSIVFSAIPPYADENGISRREVGLLLSITGAFEIFCRGFHGWFSDRNVMPCLLQLALCSGLTGLAAILCPVVGGKLGIGMLTAACGAAGTSTFSLVPIVIRQLLGPDKVTTGMGIQLFFQSSSFILSTFTAGYLTDMYGKWDPVFYYIGINLLLAFLLAGSYGTVLAIRQRQSLPVTKRID